MLYRMAAASSGISLEYRTVSPLLRIGNLPANFRGTLHQKPPDTMLGASLCM